MISTYSTPSQPSSSSTTTTTTTMNTTACLVHALPSECSLHIFSFLTLSDTMQFGQTSVTSLREILPDIWRRRMKCKQQFVCFSSWKMGNGIGGVERVTPAAEYFSSTTSPPSPATHHHRRDDDDHDDDMNVDDKGENDGKHASVIVLPTVQENVRQLCKRIPTSHHLYTTIKELNEELALFDMEEQQRDQQWMHAVSPNEFGCVFTMLRRIIRPLKLHAQILAQVIYCNPFADEVNPKLHHHHHQQQQSGATPAASLHRYLGDVLCITFCLTQSNLNLVEGGPTNASVAKELHRQQLFAVTASERTWIYNAWVYIHSTILQTKSFTNHERVRLNIPQFSKRSELVPNVVDRFFLTSQITLVLDRFGPLGPAHYRGRDLVELHTIKANSLFAFLFSSQLHDHGETGFRVIEWLCVLHEEARRARPMTVREPTVKFHIS